MRRLLFVLSLASAAQAETRWLDGSARAIAESQSASRDAPVTELAYGPRAYGSFAGSLAVVRSGATRLGLSGGLFFESDDGSGFSPDYYRDVESLSLAFLLGELELAASLGHEGSHHDRGATLDPYRTTDIPFGAGGQWLGVDLAWRLEPHPRVRVVSRLGDRFHTNAFPLWVGDREVSDHVADALGEGLIHAPFADLELRSGRALVSVHAEALVAHDDSARDAVLVRGLVGFALRGRRLELVPFLAGDAGNGEGYFVNRRELRLALGLRLMPVELE